MTFALSYIYLACSLAVLIQCSRLAASTSSQPAKAPILACMALTGLWALADFLTNIAISPGQMSALSRIFLFSWALAPAFALRAALAYTGRLGLLGAWWFWVVTFLPTVVFYWLEWTGRYHLAFVPATENAGFFQSVASGVQWGADVYMVATFGIAGWLLFAQARRTGRFEFRAPSRMFWTLLVPAAIIGALFNGSLNPVGVQLPYMGSIIGSLVVLVVARWIMKRRLFVPVALLKQQAESALQASEARYQALVDLSPDAVLVCDPGGRILSANQTAAQIFGYENPQSIRGATGQLQAFVHGADRAEAHAAADSVLLTGRVHRAEYRMLRRGASSFLADIVVGQLPGADGQPGGIICIIRDLSERVQAEEQRQLLQEQVLHSQKLESLGLLAGGIAHDFNNLIGGVLGNASLARLDLAPSSPVAERLDQIELAAERAALLSHEMLAYSGRGQFVLAYTDLRKVVEDISRLLKVSLPKKAALHLEFMEDLPLVPADAGQIQQVVMNLITNAAESFGGGSGSIALHIRRAQLATGQEQDLVSQEDIAAGDYLLLEVSDDGHGMEPGTLSQIFDPFFSTKFTGRGLGLAAVRGIVVAHRGAIQVASTPGGGTRFKVYLPVDGEGAGVAAAPAQRQDGLGSWRGQGQVLVVDDEEVLRGVICDTLRMVGFEVLAAADGPTALRSLSAGEQSIVAAVIDMTMPHMSGDELLSRLRADGADFPVVLVSGYCRDAVSCMEGMGRVTFLQKPFLPSKLILALRSFLDDPEEPEADEMIVIPGA